LFKYYIDPGETIIVVGIDGALPFDDGSIATLIVKSKKQVSPGIPVMINPEVWKELKEPEFPVKVIV